MENSQQNVFPLGKIGLTVIKYLGFLLKELNDFIYMFNGKEETTKTMIYLSHS